MSDDGQSTPTSLRDKVALITGASSGIGEATARELAAAGAKVAIGARRADKLDDLATELRKDGAEVLTLDLDVTDQQQCIDAVTQTVAELGPIDILVNNAGLMPLGKIVGADTEDWDRMITTNVLGLMYTTHAVVPAMVERGTGNVVNIASVAGRVAKAGSGVYNASKFAVAAFSESLRQEVTTEGVRVVVIEPGAVDTELNDQITDEEAKKASQDNYDSMRTLHAADIARTIAFVLTQPDYVAINEVLVRPTDQPTP